MNLYSRRDALALGGAAVATAPLLRRLRPRPRTTGLATNPFGLGVNAGDPDVTSAVLWTRLVGLDETALDDGDAPVTWEVADDESFATITASGEVTATAAEGHSVHVVAPLDGPAWYRFRTGGWTSPAGRAAPTPGEAEQLTIAAASCQNFEQGFYAAHRDLAAWRPDLVLFLGDFIYEYAGNPPGDGRVRSHRGDEIRTLDAYRDRYAQYLSDPDLQAARAACCWLAVWDDHETDNNYAGRIPEDPAEAEDFAARRLAAYQAWWEHMPVRMPRPTTDELAIHRAITWGSLAKLLVLDGRQYRSDQACGDVTMSFDPPCAEALDPGRTMLGAEQEAWTMRELGDVAQTWAVIGQQTVLTNMRMPGTGAIINYDQWDGYPTARNRMLLAAAQTERAVVLTGDIHLAAVGRLPGVGVEFVTTGVSSRGPDPSLADGLRAQFPDVVDAELAHRGYTRHTVSPERWVADYRIVSDATDPGSPVTTWKSFTVDAATPGEVTQRS